MIWIVSLGDLSWQLWKAEMDNTAPVLRAPPTCHCRLRNKQIRNRLKYLVSFTSLPPLIFLHLWMLGPHDILTESDLTVSSVTCAVVVQRVVDWISFCRAVAMLLTLLPGQYSCMLLFSIHVIHCAERCRANIFATACMNMLSWSSWTMSVTWIGFRYHLMLPVMDTSKTTDNSVRMGECVRIRVK